MVGQEHPHKSPRHMGLWETSTEHLKAGMRTHNSSTPNSLPLIKHSYMPFTGCTPCQGFFLFPLKDCLTYHRPDRKLLKRVYLKQHILHHCIQKLPFLADFFLAFLKLREKPHRVTTKVHLRSYLHLSSTNVLAASESCLTNWRSTWRNRQMLVSKIQSMNSIQVLLHLIF